MRFRKPRITFNDVDGSGNRLSKSFGMYDMATAVTIAGEDSETKLDSKLDTKSKPKVFCSSRNRWLVVAAGCDVNVFDLAVGVEHKWTISFEESNKIIGVKFLPDDDFFLIVLASGVVAMCMPLNLLMKEEKILPVMSSCSIAIANSTEQYSICVLESKGSAHFIEMKKLCTGVKREIDSFNPIKLIFSSSKINCQHVVWTMNCFAYFSQSKGDRVKYSPIQCTENSRISDWFKLKDDLHMIRNVGSFIVVLTAHNQMLFYDLCFTILHTLNLCFTDSTNARPGWSQNEHKVVDFEFLDFTDFSEFNSDMRILFNVQMGSRCEFILRSLGNSSALFHSTCSEEIVLIPHATPGDDSNIIFVEAFSSAIPNSILVRFVSEAQPSLRLKRLLDFGRFNDALEFAIQHDLSLDIVYTAFIRNCQDQILSESGYDEPIFDEMIKYLSLLSDHDEACDFCVAALMAVDKYDHIVKILNFTQQKKISDDTTLTEIANFRYELASYRMVFGANHAKFDRNSPWPAFLTSDNHLALFCQLCEQCSITEARILFSRYPLEAKSHFGTSSAIDKMFEMLGTSITENPATYVEVSEFIESDLLKYFLFNQNLNEVVAKFDKLFNFLIDTAKRLERINLKNFPENSLFFALSYQRGLTTLKQNCLTSDQQVEPILVFDILDVDPFNESQSIGRLNVLVKNLKRLVSIHRVYQCPMSYAEFLNRDVYTICYGILDRVRTAHSVRDHIDRFVFPYMVEHNLNKNEMLHKYITQLASNLYRGSSQYSNSWDQLCLLIAESIVDADLRCKAVIEIAAASVPPWSEQLMTVVKNTLSNTENVDPSLIQQLRVECRRAELGQIFVIYHIPLSFRSFAMDVVSLKALLQFIFKNSDKDPSVKLSDAFKILGIYESLMGYSMVSRVECYRLYAISIIMQLTDEYNLNELINFFQLIKLTDERTEVAWKLVQHLKCLLVETCLKKVKEQRLIWLASLLCVLERFVPNNSDVDTVIQQTRNIRRLQSQHNLVVGFSTLNDVKKCSNHLAAFVNEGSNKKSLFEVVNFGRLFSMSMRDIFCTIVDIHLDNSLAEASMSTLEFYLERESSPEPSDLEVCLHVCTSTLWNITNAAVDSGTEFDPLVRIVKLFKNVLPILLDWSTNLQSIIHVDAFCKINGYVTLLSHILDRCPVDKCDLFEREVKTPDEFEYLKGRDIMYTNRRRVGAFLPFNEGSFFDHSNVIRNAAIVASSVVKPPMNDENDIAKFNNEMREYWLRLYDSLSSHNFLEICVRQFSYSLPCFCCVADDTPMIGLPQCISELCQKILNVSTADLLLAAHLLLRLLMPNMKQILQELRRWVTSNRKSVRVSLNVIRLSLFVLIESKDFSLRQQIAGMFETTLWQKRFTKLGVLAVSSQQLRKESALELVGDFVKVLISPSILKQFCLEMQVPSRIMLSYAIELCKVSSGFIKEHERFSKTVDTAKAAFREVEADEDAILEIVSVIEQMCPYNYEILELLLKQLEEWNENRQMDYDTWTKDRLLLLEFLKYVKREKKYTQEEIKWYRNRSSNKNLDTSSGSSNVRNSVNETTLMEDENETMAPNSVSALLGGLYRKQDVFETNLPPVSVDRLPFHVFLSTVDFHVSLMLPIIHNEINIYNVLKWTSIIKETEGILNCSKTLLIVTAIHHDVVDAIKYKRELLDYDLKQICRLMNDSLRRVTVLKSLGQKFRKLPLCDVKISIFQVCYDVVNQCIENWIECDEDINDYVIYRDALKRTLAQFTTDLLLSKNHLLNSNTSVLSHDAIPLISYVCSNSIDWNDDANIDSHFGVVENIAKVNEVNLSAVYDELILSWLPGGENIEVGNMAHSDPDATIDFVGSDNTPAAALSGNGLMDEDVPLPVLYSDPSLSKIVFLLKKCDPQQKARMIYMKFEQESTFTPGGFTTKIRTACCLIRYLSNEQMQNILLIDKMQFCSRLIQLLNHRFLTISRMGISIQDYQTADKAEFARSILSPQSYRQTPEVSYLLTCVIVDNDIKDAVLIGKAAYRLFQLRMMKPLTVLLEYTRQLADAKLIANIAMYYARVFEWMFDKADIDDDESARKISIMIYNLIGCPVEGGANFLRAKTLLARAPCAAALVSIAGSATEKTNELNVKTNPVSVSFDFTLNRNYI